MDIPADRPRTSQGPKTRVCYVCGRQYGLHSYEIHLKQCKELWVARESQKDPRDRKPLPEDPNQGREEAGPASPPKGTCTSNGSPNGVPSASEIEEMNRLASQAYNTESLTPCQYCGRTFLPEKLAIHNKSCTADRPARRVDEKVRKGTEIPQISGPSPTRPMSSYARGAREREKGNDKENIPNSSSEGNPGIAGGDDAGLDHQNLAGHIGGTAGRGIRKNRNNSDEGNASETALNTFHGIPKPSNQADKKEVVEYLQKKIASMEVVVEDLTQNLAEMKKQLAALQA